MKALIKAPFLDIAAFRLYFLLTIMGNMVYMVIIYFLWKAIFAGTGKEVLNGMTFYDTFIYLALAGCLASVVAVFVEWHMSNEMKNGDIVLSFIKPIDYQLLTFCDALGNIFSNFLIVFIPSFVVVFILSKGHIKFGINILMFLFSFLLGAIVNFLIDFLVGLLSFYTESVWGVSTMKEVIVSVLAGQIIPIAFFPEPFKTIVEWMPFQTIFSLPLQILINNDFGYMDYLRIIGIQMIWIIILFIISRLCYKKAVTVLTVNGG